MAANQMKAASNGEMKCNQYLKYHEMIAMVMANVA